MGRKPVTIVVDEELWKRLKIQAIGESKTVSECVEEMIRRKVR